MMEKSEISPLNIKSTLPTRFVCGRCGNETFKLVRENGRLVAECMFCDSPVIQIHCVCDFGEMKGKGY
jgi:transcription elongation factor Elf1